MIVNDRLVIRRRIENSKKFVSIMEGMRLKGTMKNGEINSFFFSEFTLSLNFNTEKYSIYEYNEYEITKYIFKFSSDLDIRKSKKQNSFKLKNQHHHFQFLPRIQFISSINSIDDLKILLFLSISI